MKFILTEEVQKTVNKEMLEQIGDFVLRFAHIESNDENVRETVEATFESTEDELFQNRYFDSYESAYSWVKEAIK